MPADKSKEPYIQLEYEWGKWAGVENVVACSSGTAALHLALEAYQFRQGSEVILPDYTMVACARAITLSGHTPVFVDCRQDNLLLNVKILEDAVTDKTRAIMAVHIYGRYCDMKSIHEVADKYDLMVIEDLAEAHGIPPHPNTHAACWSFYRNKIVSGEEGGAVAFKEQGQAALAKCLRSLGFTHAQDYRHIPRGHNYRMSNSHASMILRSLGQSSENVSKRRQIEEWYNDVFKWDVEWLMPKREAVWVYDIAISDLVCDKQNAIVKALWENGIQARHGFKPMHTQEEYQGCRRVGGEVAALMSTRVVYLPCDPGVITWATARKARSVILDAMRE